MHRSPPVPHHREAHRTGHDLLHRVVIAAFRLLSGIVALYDRWLPEAHRRVLRRQLRRTMFTPPAQLPTGTAQDCTAPPGAEMQYFENLDTNAPSTANGGIGSRTMHERGHRPGPAPAGADRRQVASRASNDYLRTNSISASPQGRSPHGVGRQAPSADVMVSGTHTETRSTTSS